MNLLTDKQLTTSDQISERLASVLRQHAELCGKDSPSFRYPDVYAKHNARIAKLKERASSLSIRLRATLNP